MKAPDLSKHTPQELMVLHCLFEGLTVNETRRIVKQQASAIGYLRRKALKKMGTINLVMAVRLLCLAGWNDETEDYGDEEDGQGRSEDRGTYHA